MLLKRELNIQQPNLLVISPVYNEAGNLVEFLKQLAALRANHTELANLQLILVDDGSEDGSFEKILELSELYPWLAYRQLTGNFGHQAALLSGLSSLNDWNDSWSDLVVTLDSDLEHPPQTILSMVQLWQTKKVQLVQAIRKSHSSLPLHKKLLSRLFYIVTARLTGLKLVDGQADYCLWDAQVIRQLTPYLHYIGSLRVFAAWLPVSKAVVYFEQNLRTHGHSQFTLDQNWNLAINSIIRFSNTPLRLITWLGVIGVLGSLIHLLQILLAIYNNEALTPGWTTLILTVIFMGCFQLICLGILASYLRRIVFSKNLPLFLIKRDKKIILPHS